MTLLELTPFLALCFLGGPYSLSFFSLPLRHKRRVRRFLSLLRMSLPHSLGSPATEMHHTWKKSTCFSSPSPFLTGLGEAPEWPTLYSTTDAAVAQPWFQLHLQQQVKKEEERREPTFLPVVCEWKSWAEFAEWLFLLEGPFAHLDNELFSGPPVSPNIFAFKKTQRVTHHALTNL